MTYQQNVERLTEIAKNAVLEVFFLSIQKEQSDRIDKVVIRRIEFQSTYEKWWQRVFNVLMEADNDFREKRPFRIRQR